jgi:trimeric autotransporter adhesin
MSLGRVRWSVLILLGFLVVGVAHAQIRSATITGSITDASGSVVPGAVVVVTEQDTGIANTTKSTDAGQYTVPYLPAGTYTVAVTATGFAPYRQTGIVLGTAQTARADVGLKVASIGTTVEVQAQAALIQTDSSTIQSSVGAGMIASLPNPTQNPLFYAFLQAGVMPNNSTADTTSTNSFGVGVDGRRQWSSVSVNGGRAFTNDIQLDGLPVMGGGYNEASVLPNTEGLQEVRVIANNFGAQYGHGQAVLSMSTKSGTNGFHGQGSYRLRNEFLRANTASNKASNSAQYPQGILRPAFKVNEFGGSVGGPIVKDKLFFSSSYHYLRYNQGATTLTTVPTALERVGNFSQTSIRSESGAAVPAQIFDPWNVTQLGPDLFQRALIPNANLTSLANQYALKMYSYYPDPNRTPDDAFNTNNYQVTVVVPTRRHNMNNRIDYRLGKHSIYGSGGFSYATNTVPRPFGKAPFNDAPSIKSDKNPYAQIGDTIVVSPTLVLDIRYGVSRIQTKAVRGNKTGWDAGAYAAMGVPANIQPLFLTPGSAPGVQPNAFSGGNGGGSNWVAVSDVGFGNKREQQANHSLALSATKIRGTWTHKFGLEARNLLSNYQDSEEQSAQIASSYYHVGGNFNFQYVTASGGVASQVTSNAQRGVNGAALLLGAPSWFIRPGTNVPPAFSQKYFAFYTQNDWRATAKLTLNFGMRWDLQPGPTERYNRMSSIDLTARNAFGYQGATVFPGVNGYSRNLWETTYDNWGPRFGAAYQIDPSTVVRGGFGITYLPSNSGYFSGATDYGSNSFSSGTMELPYGTSPNGVPVMRFWDPHGLNLAVGANPGAPSVYGTSESKFDRFYKNGRAMQWNFFFEKRFFGSWFASLGYSASHSTNLMNRAVPVNSLQFLPQATLDNWRASYIASNAVTNPANVLVTNPFQPTSGPLYGFTGTLGAATLAQSNTLFPYPLLNATQISMTKAWADYNSMQFRLSHSFSKGYQLDVNYTWSKELDNTDNMADNQGQNAGGQQVGSGVLDLKNWRNNRRIGVGDVPHRLTATFMADLPFGSGKAIDVDNPVFRAVAAGWQVGGSWTWQAGMPVVLSGASNGAAFPHPDRVAGAPLEVPQELQHWYDGNTTVTLPNGRKVKPTKNTFLKYYTGAFSGRVVQLPNGNYNYDQFWYGTMSPTLNDMRGPGRFNIDLSLRRSLKIREGIRLELAAESTNLLNNTQLSGMYSGALGNTQTTTNTASGLVPGMGQSDTFGTIGLGTFDPREVILSLKVHF